MEVKIQFISVISEVYFVRNHVNLLFLYIVLPVYLHLCHLLVGYPLPQHVAESLLRLRVGGGSYSARVHARCGHKLTLLYYEIKFYT